MNDTEVARSDTSQCSEPEVTVTGVCNEDLGDFGGVSFTLSAADSIIPISDIYYTAAIYDQDGNYVVGDTGFLVSGGSDTIDVLLESASDARQFYLEYEGDFSDFETLTSELVGPCVEIDVAVEISCDVEYPIAVIQNNSSITLDTYWEALDASGNVIESDVYEADAGDTEYVYLSLGTVATFNLYLGNDNTGTLLESAAIECASPTVAATGVCYDDVGNGGVTFTLSLAEESDGGLSGLYVAYTVYDQNGNSWESSTVGVYSGSETELSFEFENRNPENGFYMVYETNYAGDMAQTELIYACEPEVSIEVSCESAYPVVAIQNLEAYPISITWEATDAGSNVLLSDTAQIGANSTEYAYIYEVKPVTFAVLWEDSSDPVLLGSAAIECASPTVTVTGVCYDDVGNGGVTFTLSLAEESDGGLSGLYPAYTVYDQDENNSGLTDKDPSLFLRYPILFCLPMLPSKHIICFYFNGVFPNF